MNSMEEDLKDIELFIDFCRAPYNFEHELDAKSYKELSNKIEHLIKAYKELEEENRIFALEGSRVRLKIHIDKNYIPVSLVEEKIEELKKYRDIAKELIEEKVVIADSDSLNYGRAEAHDKDIQVLEELLEKR